MKIPNKSVSWHSSKKKCVNFFLQINGFQPTITIKRRMVQRHRLQKSEQLSAPAKSHRRHQNNWSTRLSCRWQIKRHTLKVSDLYQSVFILFVARKISLHLVLRKISRQRKKITTTITTTQCWFSYFEIHLAVIVLFWWSKTKMWVSKWVRFRNGSSNWPYLVLQTSFFHI